MGKYFKARFASLWIVGLSTSHPALTTAQETPAAPIAAHAATPAQTPEIEPTPAWVRPRTVPEATPSRIARAQKGVAYLLVDEQYRTHSTGHDDWFRIATKVTNRSGLEDAGQITVNYNPAFETVGIDFVHLIRDGKVIDLTKETRFRIVEREDQLSDGIVSGTLKVIANLQDVRVGDVVDYATTTHVRTDLWPGHTFYHFSQRYSDAVALRALRLIWPDGSAPRYKTINSDIVFPSRQTAGGTEWEWMATDPPAMQADDDVPATAFVWGRIDISTMPTWSETARWAAGLYKGDDSLPADFAARIDAIASRWPSASDRLTEATRLVQDTIRYVGEEMGEGSYVPRRPKTVLARGYGDCKDKSLLLAVALRRLGIDAVPALVSTVAGQRLPDRLPSPLQFDHVIVRAVVDGQVLWIDATGSHRGGRGTAIVQSDLGYALPVRAGQTMLEPIVGYQERAGRMTVLERFAVDETAETPLTLLVETRYTDARADSMRARWAASSVQKISADNLEFYQNRFPGLTEDKPLALRDDRDANVLTMVESYTMPRAAFVKADIPTKLVTRAYALTSVMPDRQSRPRTQPLGLNALLNNEQVIDLHVRDRVLTPLDDIEMKSGTIAFSRRTVPLDDGLRLTYRIDTGDRPAVPAAEAPAVYAISDRIKDETGIEFYLTESPRPTAAPGEIDPAVWSPIKADMEKAVALIQKEDQPSRLEALSLLTGVSARVPHPSPAAGLVDGLRGAILSDLHRPEPAFAALRSATEQYGGNPPVFRLWIGYELDLGTAESVAKAMQRTRQAQPSVLAGLDTQWVTMAFQKVRKLDPGKRETVRGDICLALAESGYQQAPRTSSGAGVLDCAIQAHARRGEFAEARAALGKSPPTRTLVTLARDYRYRILWPDLDPYVADGFRKPLDRQAAQAVTDAKAAPRDYELARSAINALMAVGRVREAVDAGKALATDKPQIEIVGNPAFWLVNDYAIALHAANRTDDAIAALDGVIALGVAHNPELVSLHINRAGIKLDAGRYQAALDDLSTLDDATTALSDYGRMWIWAHRACALRALGRLDEAKAFETRLTAKPADNWSAATFAAACRRDVAAIADMIVARLRDDDARGDVLDLFMTFETPLGQTADQKMRREVMDKARAVLAVQAELAKHARPIRYAGTSRGWMEF